MRIVKAVIAAAGYGTRFLPATKVIPKEMLPLLDRPIIQVLVEELVALGIKEVIIVTRPGAVLIKEHFRPQVAMERHLKKQGKQELLANLKKIGKMAKITFVEQEAKLPYGTGAPLVSAARHIRKGECFVFLFGDDLVKARTPATKQLIKLWQKNKKAVILACQEVPRSEVSRYGIVKLKKESRDEVEDFVEKPKPEEAPSCLASFGRFILNREIIDILLAQKKNVGSKREFYLTDAIAAYAQKGLVLAAKIQGQWLTIGDPLNWLKANIEFALGREEFGQEFKTYLKELLSQRVS